MGRPENVSLRVAWESRLARHAVSGMSVGEFCRREGVSAANYYVWKRKLTAGPKSASHAGGDGRRGTRCGVERGRPRVAATARQAPEVRFVQIPFSAPSGDGAVELSLADGTVLRCPTQNLAALELALTTLLNGRPTARAAEVSHV